MIKNIHHHRMHFTILMQLPLYILLLCLFGLTGWYFYLNYSLFPTTEKKLQKIMISTERTINSYLKTIEKNAHELAEDSQTKHFFNELLSQSASKKSIKNFTSFILLQQESMNFKNILLIDANKTIQFSLDKNIINKRLDIQEHRHSFLGLSYERSMMSLTPDFSEYGHDPLFEHPTLFLTIPVIHNKKFIGILAYECNVDKIATITNQYTGLGETGEIILAEENDAFILYITPSRHDPDLAFKRRKLFSKNPPSIQKSILGEQGIGTAIDYRNIPIIGAWTFIPKVNWGMIVKIDQSEVQEPLTFILKLLLLCMICIIVWIIIIEYFCNKPFTHYIHSLQKKQFVKKIPSTIKNPFFFMLLLSCILLMKTIISYYNISVTTINEEKQNIINDIKNGAEEINQILKKISFTAQSIADDLKFQRLSQDDIAKRLKRDLSENNNILNIIIAFAPYKYNSETKLYAPSIYKSDNSYKEIMIENLYDYTNPDPNNKITAWYRKALQVKQVWLNTYNMPPSYSTAFFNNNNELQGVICITYKFNPIERITVYSSLDRKGYSVLLSESENFLSHPINSLVSSEKTLMEYAQENGSQTLIKIAQILSKNRPLLASYRTQNDPQLMWMYAEPIAVNNWTLIAIFSKEDISLPSHIIRHYFFWILIYAIGSILLACTYLFSIQKIRLIILVIAVNLFLSLGLIIAWRIIQLTASIKKGRSTIVLDQASLDKFLEDLETEAIRKHESPPIQIPCGLLLYSLDMTQPDHMTISGYLWTKYNLKNHKDIIHKIQLPHAIQLINDYPTTSINGDWETVTWNIRGTIYEKQYYSQFPFDKQQMQITIEHHDIEKNIILIPDLEDYKKISPEETPGLDKNFTLSEFNIERTFFSYKQLEPVTNYGFTEYGKTTDHFQLIYNLIITRGLLGPFVLYVLPLLVVLFSLFAILLVSKRHSKPLTIIAPYTGLFFALILLHRTLREQYSTSATLYIEYSFFFTYITIIILVIHTVITHLYPHWNYYQQKIFPLAKILFWPFQLISWLITTFIIFY